MSLKPSDWNWKTLLIYKYFNEKVYPKFFGSMKYLQKEKTLPFAGYKNSCLNNSEIFSSYPFSRELKAPIYIVSTGFGWNKFQNSFFHSRLSFSKCKSISREKSFQLYFIRKVFINICTCCLLQIYLQDFINWKYIWFDLLSYLKKAKTIVTDSTFFYTYGWFLPFFRKAKLKVHQQSRT